MNNRLLQSNFYNRIDDTVNIAFTIPFIRTELEKKVQK